MAHESYHIVAKYKSDINPDALARLVLRLALQLAEQESHDERHDHSEPDERDEDQEAA